MELLLIFIVISMCTLAIERIYSYVWSKGLRIQIGFSKTYVKNGEKTDIIEKLYNISHVFMPVITLKYVIHRNGEEYEHKMETFSLLYRQKVTRKSAFDTSKRGVYTIDKVYASSKGIFLRELYVHNYEYEAGMIVYPKLSDVSAINIPAIVLSGDYKSDTRLIENPFFFRGIRDYDSKDSVSRINWNATAVTGKMMVNSFDDSRNMSLTIMLQLPDDKINYAKELAEESISVAAGIYKEMLAKNMPVSFTCNGTDCITGYQIMLPERSDAAYLNVALESLARVNENNLVKDVYIKEAVSQSTIILIAQAIDVNGTIIAKVREMCNKGYKVVWVIVEKRGTVDEKDIEKQVSDFRKDNLSINMWWI